MDNLTLEAATLVNKLSGKAIDKFKKEGTHLKPGSYTVTETIRVDGSVSRGDATKVTPAFRMDSYYKALILKYASMQDDPKAWLNSVMDIHGALGAVITLGPDAVLKTVDAELVAIHDLCVAEGKAKYQTVAKKVDRSGNTTVIGELSTGIGEVARPSEMAELEVATDVSRTSA